ncbi:MULTISPECIES: DUF262 domain-containing protein [unclassified Coleofasciculus]|uniref:DUF262 domain-containing protein n=1 Tax=unclassified Coleofasciculus TaxID=2692782 RepID=UPI00187E7187|nr:MULTISPECIES: DUF262 domain-containing protein [unclassified Coleofasciculus]MBE9126214.1 DUF262 domain-containing protein [Coleofasciculus sp. LEGE 07081]MBE9148124.1 DUF262 domain-containing protein [Coleofasciculus sp. LEGE 07092]
MPPKQEITDELREAAEAEIWEKQKPVDYDTKEYPVEILVQKYIDGRDDDTNELFIPDYQREMAWDETRQSKFIESVLLGLPIPYIFVADIYDEVNDLGRLEIVDGTQRIRTLARFLNNELTLKKLEKLGKLNDFTFADLPLARQRRFKRSTLRMIQLTEKADEEVRRDMFERINTGSVDLTDMEKRRGISPGPFLDLIEELSENSKFRNLCPFSEASIRRREPQEFVLRFFAYLNNYENFERRVNEFLNDYLKENNREGLDRQGMKYEFQSMLNFVEAHFLNGFSKAKGYTRTPRIRFEAISVGVALALREKSNLEPKSMKWLNSDEFKEYTTSDASNSRPKVIRRIEYVRDQLLRKS